MFVAFDGRLAEEVFPNVFVFQEDGGYRDLDDGLYWPGHVNIKELEDGGWVSRLYKLEGYLRWMPNPIPNPPHGQHGEFRIYRVWYSLMKQDRYTADKKWLGSCEPTLHQTETMKKGRLKRSEMEKYITRTAEE